MKQSLALLALAATSFAAHAAIDSYALDPVHTVAIFQVEHLGLSDFYGRFDKTNGKVAIDRAAKTGILATAVPRMTAAQTSQCSFR